MKIYSSSEVATIIEGILHHCDDMNVEKNYVDHDGQIERSRLATSVRDPRRCPDR